MRCTRLAEIQDVKNRQKFAIWEPSHNFVGLQLRHVSKIGKKLLNSNIFSTCPHSPQYRASFGPLTAEIGLPIWGTPANFNGFRVLPSLLQRHRSAEANQTLHDVWPSPGLLRYVYVFGGACPLTEFGQLQNSLYVPSLAFSHIGSVTARHFSSGCQSNFEVWYKEWNYGTFADGAT